ncbi:MAG: class I SAM-dependent methyltransferase [candidate division KSB1 bacterium]|nr:class I SAM-dependent methyltransferase [candidate division KSB1 bacterium]MDZ7275835.1 class I SAM-dependent methyltransferase [candidate division KSB1 bacterium]MDZ7287585.1 class I SAM-dependent methyltransferase [candidate division KSB1 bacterium]MDZ7306511.1 class I SAM-dependent methyltransferase [candidate division KSB1 bacterium]MDZ7350563.1 class I SAM-dependent methyltransferase [candidate division KSB1 bacterium]
MREFYDAFAPFYNDFYDLIDYPAWASLIQEVLDELLPPPRRVLEAGCGTGAMLAEIALAPHQTCVGVDQSRPMLDICAKKCFVNARPALVQGNLLGLGFRDESFDAVLGVFSLLNLYGAAGRRALLAEVRRVLRPNGIFLTDFATIGRYFQLREAASRGRETSHWESAFEIQQSFPAQAVLSETGECVIDRILRTGSQTVQHRMYFFETTALLAELAAAGLEAIRTGPLVPDSSAATANRLMLIGRKPCNASMRTSSTNASRSSASTRA